MEKKPTVVYIVSDRRSGSTLLENILSKSNEVTSVGELAMLHGHILRAGPGERWNWNCSCGETVQQCVFWSGIIRDTYKKDPSVFNTNIEWSFKAKKFLAVALLPFLFRNKLLSILNGKKNRDVAGTLSLLYSKIFEQTGKPFIVDSSKDPLQALCIYKSKRDFDVKIIWLKRDLRAIAVSKTRWKELNIKKKKTLKKILLDVFYYKRICRAVAGFIKGEDLLTIQYETVAQHTQQELDIVTTKFGMNSYTAPEFMFVEDDHTIGGTPNRFEKRPITYDESWKKAYEKKQLLYFTGGVLNKF
ncbi:MAG: sulfotransferase [Panacibacter sp.]